MGAIIHDGERVPAFDEAWDVYDIDWVWFAWDDVLDGATIATSVWVTPDGWTLEQQSDDTAVTDGAGVTYSHANGARFTAASAEPGRRAVIANRVTISDGRAFERSVAVLLAEQ